MGRLDDKVAIITGSARGIGREMALRFAAEGAHIVVSDILVPRMHETVEEIRGLGRKAMATKADVSKREDVESLVAVAIDAFKRVDILVNNAGICHTTNFEDITEQDWDAVFSVNLKGALFCTQAIMRHMMARRYGKLINMSSHAGIGGSFTPQLAHYACAKAGTIQLTKLTARILGPYGVNVNAIAAGTIMTEMQEEFSDESRQIGLKNTLLGREGDPVDVANLALFLASDESSFITGQVIACDGGRADLL